MYHESDEETDTITIESTRYPEDLAKDNKVCLVNGYTREQSQDDIPSEIIKLFYDYYDIATYWKIDKELLSEMREAKTYQQFHSTKFKYTVNNTVIEWYLEIVPNESGYFRHYITVKPWPDNIKSVICIGRMSLSGCKDDGKHNTTIRLIKRATIFTKKNYYFASRHSLKLKDIENMNFDALLFEASIDFIAVRSNTTYGLPYYINGQKFDIDKEIEVKLEIDDGMVKEWKSASAGKVFYLKTFGKTGNWSLWIAPNGETRKRRGNVVLALTLLRVNDGIDHNVTCKYKFEMICDGEVISFEEPAEFIMDQSYWHWPEDTYLTTQLQDISSVQISVKIWDIEIKAKD